jgi:hypothetical protein
MAAVSVGRNAGAFESSSGPESFRPAIVLLIHGNAFGFVMLNGLRPHRMPHHVDRPTKTCPVCGRPFQWRRKWKLVWEEVRYCSERCRRNRNRARPDSSEAPQISNTATSAA